MKLKWLDESPKFKTGVSFGIPWRKGELFPNEIQKTSALNDTILQNGIMAYWNDGSVKWTKHAGTFDKNAEINEFQIKEDSQHSENKETQNLAIEKFNGIYIADGSFMAFFPKHGAGKNLLDVIRKDGQVYLKNLRLTAKVNNENYISKVEDVSLEDNGAIMAVVKVTGAIYKDAEELQKYIVRFKFYKGTNQVDITHTIIIVSDKNIQEIALSYDSVLKGDAWNRHIRIAGEDGIYNEPAKLLISRRFHIDNKKYEKQLNGEMVTFKKCDELMLQSAEGNAIWDNYFLSQKMHNYFEIRKQTNKNCAQVKIGDGTHAKGFLYTGGENGGVAVSVKDFYKKTPSMIEVNGLTQKETNVKICLWSEEGGEIDFRHYSEQDHMFAAYEGMEEIRSTPIGIANTSKIKINILSKTEKIPTNEILYAMAQEGATPSQIVSTPQEYYDTKVFGVWSLPKTETKTGRFLESQLEELLQFYKNEVVQRGWYGYWNYGDFMHTYDVKRHMWRYDLGGFAWQNTELVPNIWLWQYFLRTGSVDAYYLAEAMTRHTAEVDRYHLGEYKGLGSRHNVLHWGCQCKEVRISMAGLHRYYYYITADERMADILSDVKDNEYAFEKLEPLREFYKPQDNLIPIRSGPDWSALVSNWFTEWERTGNAEYLERITKGIKSIEKTEFRLLSGPSFLFDSDKKELYEFGIGNVGGYHMIISFGAPQVWMELAQNIDDKKWEEMLAEFGKFYAFSDEEKSAATDGKLLGNHFSWPMFATGMMAYAAKHYNDETLAKKTWEYLSEPEKSGVPIPIQDTLREVVTWQKIKEMPWVTTNCVSQWCINVMLCMELIGEYMPEVDF